MLSGFECDDDQTGWLAGAALWATGAAAGFLLAIADPTVSLVHWQVLVLALAVSIVSVGVRLPVLFAKCDVPAWLLHAIWMFAFFAQVNWAGFLATRAPSGMIAAEALLICFGIEAWLMYAGRSKLPWFFSLFDGFDPQSDSKSNSQSGARAVGSVITANNASSNKTTLQISREESPHSLRLARETFSAHATEKHAEQYAEPEDDGADIRREFVDGIDENGMRYLSGLVKLDLEPNQRTEVILLSFCPALSAPANIELECDDEQVTAKVEHATETGARILVRRSQISDAATVSVEWFAQASDDSRHTQPANLP